MIVYNCSEGHRDGGQKVERDHVLKVQNQFVSSIENCLYYHAF